MTRTTLAIGPDWMLQIEAFSHGWELCTLKRSDPLWSEMWIEPDRAAMVKRAGDLARDLVIEQLT